MHTYLITGGAGFIGNCLVRRMLARGDRVVNLDLLTYAGNLESLGEFRTHPRHCFIQGDVCDGGLLRRIFAAERPRAVAHLAAETHVDRSIDGPAPFVQTNTAGACALLQAAYLHWRELPVEEKRAFRMLQVSTDEVYGSAPEGVWFAEDAPYRPSSPYAASKAGADHLADAFFNTYHLPVIVTHASNNFGPYQFPEKLIPLMIARALRQEPLPLYGDGRQRRDWLSVEDHCRALELLLERGAPGAHYNIGGGAERTNLELVQALCGHVDELTGRPLGSSAQLITSVADRPGHDRRYAIDCRRIQALGWRAIGNFEERLREVVGWCCFHRDWYERILTGAYRLERLGALAGSGA